LVRWNHYLELVHGNYYISAPRVTGVAIFYDTYKKRSNSPSTVASFDTYLI